MKDLDLALARRTALFARMEAEGTDACRLFCGEREGVAGVVVDRYGPLVVVQWHEGKCRLDDEALRRVGSFYIERLGVSSVYLKRFIADRSHALAEEAMYSPEPLAGERADPQVTVREHGVKYLIRPYAGFSTGLFLDQRENRRFLAALGAGGDVLNGFSYTCGFSVALARRGARVTSVDLSRKALDWGRENFRANSLPLDGHVFVADDVFGYLKRAVRKGTRYDLVILDPPSFSRGKGGVFSVKKDLGRLLEAALPVAKRGGRLFFSTNYSEWDEAELGRRVLALGLSRVTGLPAVPDDFAPQVGGLSAVLVET